MSDGLGLVGKFVPDLIENPSDYGVTEEELTQFYEFVGKYIAFTDGARLSVGKESYYLGNAEGFVEAFHVVNSKEKK